MQMTMISDGLDRPLERPVWLRMKGAGSIFQWDDGGRLELGAVASGWW